MAFRAFWRLRRRRRKKIARVRRTRAAAEPVAIPAIVPLVFCFSGVISGAVCVVDEEESWAVGGGWVGDGVEVEEEVKMVLDVGVGVGVVEERVISVVGRDVGWDAGRDMLDEDTCDCSGRLVGRDDEMSEIGLAVYLDVGLSLSLEVVGLGPGLDVEVVIWSVGREGDESEVVGLVVSALLVANRSCVTTLNPASIDDATSTGKAASSTERAFSGSSCGLLEPDMLSFEPLDEEVVRFTISEATWSIATMM